MLALAAYTGSVLAETVNNAAVAICKERVRNELTRKAHGRKEPDRKKRVRKEPARKAPILKRLVPTVFGGRANLRRDDRRKYKTGDVTKTTSC
ncbi:hypothetical protein ACOJR9_09415 [Alteromonas sp. A081]|uniref:hypothetical protein n=1 Tax=Alteromonas sp. A081 TaxID=3410269 RepID=UPI003B9867AE